MIFIDFVELLFLMFMPSFKITGRLVLENKILQHFAIYSDQNQNQNSLLVKRQTDNTTPGGGVLTGGD